MNLECVKFVADLSIPMRFGGPQPNAYGVHEARSEPVRAGDLIGDTRLGGSVNFEQYTFIPHCNGTHTECVGHVTHERISIRDCLKDAFTGAVLISVEPKFVDNEPLITEDDLRIALAEQTAVSGDGTGFQEKYALIVRTLPNDDDKLTRKYGIADQNAVRIPPYFTAEAVRFIVESRFRHLLTDLPSIDRLYDDGKLVNHRIFWNLEEGSFERNALTRVDSSITELIYVPVEIADGEYLLNLQIAPFDSDCAPSRPILLQVK